MVLINNLKNIINFGVDWRNQTCDCALGGGCSIQAINNFIERLAKEIYLR